MIRRLSAVFLFGSLWVFSFAQQPGNSQSQDQGKTQAANALARAGCGPIQVRFDVKTDKTQHPAAQPEPGKALVYVFEEDDTANASPTMRVGLDSKWMGANQSQAYFFFSVDAGEHRLCTDWQENNEQLSKLGAALIFTAEIGKTYYFRTRIRTVRDFAVDLKPVDSAEGQFLISSYALSTSHVKQPEPPPPSSFANPNGELDFGKELSGTEHWLSRQ